MAYGFVPIVHLVAVVLSIIELGLTAFDVSVFHGYFYNDGVYYDGDSSPSQLNFMLFNSIWSLAVLAYIGITPLFMAHFFYKLASLALESITMLFWFAGSIAVAIWLGVPNCGGDTSCGAFQAAVVFGFFLWYVLYYFHLKCLKTGGFVLTRVTGSCSASSLSSTPSRRCALAAATPLPRTTRLLLMLVRKSAYI